jgi:hypothetical protein
MNFSTDLIKMLYELLYERKFIITLGGIKKSSNIFKINNGVQQGSITAPILFNLYTADLIAHKNLNSKSTQACAYADDMIVYCSAYHVGEIQKNLQSSLDFIQNYFKLWHIEINSLKCDAILFRRPLKNATRDLKRNWRKLLVKIQNQPVKLREQIKYLGVNIDHMCYMSQHTKIQLEKARRAFMGARQLFYNKYLDKRVKLIAYKSLIRPILTYGCQVWFNQAPSHMEKYRIFERKCLRHCNGLYRKAETDFTHYVSNRIQYEKFDSDRIDIHILKLTRNHIRRACNNTENSLIYGPYHVDDQLAKLYATNETVPGPNLFVYFDRLGYIQDREAVPLIYHIARRPNEKWFVAEKFNNPDEYIRFDTTIKITDDEYQKRCETYWWLSDMAGEDENIDDDIDDQQQQHHQQQQQPTATITVAFLICEIFLF